MNRRIARPLLLLTCALLAGGALSASSAQAAGEATVEIGAQAGLRALVLVTVPVRITCPTGVNFERSQSDAPIEQASGQAIAHANMIEPDQPVVCDGTPHQASFVAMADTSGPPFHTGEAAIRMSFQFCTPSFQCVSGNSGFRVIQLRSSS